MIPSGERLLRPILAFLTLCLAAFLLAPTVASVHEKVEGLKIDRQLPWEIWKWTDEPEPNILNGCGKQTRHLYSEVTQWPDRIRKDEGFTLRGIVQSEEDGRRGVSLIRVDLFLNETKEEPGVHLGEVTSQDGFFELTTVIPFELPASHYHIVAHAKGRVIDCTTYLEHWSDPETDVVSDTSFEFDPIPHPVAGRNFTFSGRLLDAVGAPVRNVNITVSIGGDTEKLTTDSAGAFSLEHKPEKAGNVTAKASYKGGRYYEASSNETRIHVEREWLELAVGTDGLTIDRSTPVGVAGTIYVAPSALGDNVTIRFDGIQVVPCDGCEPTDTFQAPVDEAGAFSATIVVPPSQKPGRGTFTVMDGGLEESYTYPFSLFMPTRVEIATNVDGLFAREYTGNVSVTDEVGRPLVATLAIAGPEGWTSGVTDGNGTMAFGSAAPCGRHPVQAIYNGTDHVRPSSAQEEVSVCGWLAFVPPWLLAVPLWVWPLVLAGIVGGIWLARRLRQAYSPVIMRGPPLHLAFTQPADEAAGFAAVGETIVVSASLESPLPDGHTLRLGAPRDTQPHPLDAELRAHMTLVPEALGPMAIRAEIVDAKGNVVSRRTITLHVIRYAEEIESRYLALRSGSGVTDDVTPREFERWLMQRAPDLDPALTRRLVHLFEEADYSPRTAGRAEFAAYLTAEGGVQEVSTPALR